MSRSIAYLGVNEKFRYMVCDTLADRPLTGLTKGEIAFVLETGHFYGAINAFTWSTPLPLGGGGGGPGPTFAYGVIPSGDTDGDNDIFILPSVPYPPESLLLFSGGMMLRPGPGNDFTLLFNVITMNPGSAPEPGTSLYANYQTS